MTPTMTPRPVPAVAGLRAGRDMPDALRCVRVREGACAAERRRVAERASARRGKRVRRRAGSDMRGTGDDDGTESAEACGGEQARARRCCCCCRVAQPSATLRAPRGGRRSAPARDRRSSAACALCPFARCQRRPKALQHTADAAAHARTAARAATSLAATQLCAHSRRCGVRACGGAAAAAAAATFVRGARGGGGAKKAVS